MDASHINEVTTRFRWATDSIDTGDWEDAARECEEALGLIRVEVDRQEAALETAALGIGLTLYSVPVNEEQREHQEEKGVSVGQWEDPWKPAKTLGGGWAVLDTRDMSWLKPPMDTQESATERTDHLNGTVRAAAIEALVIEAKKRKAS